MARMNVLVYSDSGTSRLNTLHTFDTLRRLLPTYSISPVTSATLTNEHWIDSCALLVIPGGSDLDYSKALNGAGNDRIRTFVSSGGSYLGFCAGGYYGCGVVEFASRENGVFIPGGRQLSFFPGSCRGAAFRGFEYGNERGAKAVRLVEDGNGKAVGEWSSYFNGGGVFIDADSYQKEGVEVLARYIEKVQVEGGRGQAAAVFCKVGEGRAILTGPHPEYDGYRLEFGDAEESYRKVVEAVRKDGEMRVGFLKRILRKLGLNVVEGAGKTMAESGMHLTGIESQKVAGVLGGLEQVIEQKDGMGLLRCENDTFVLHREDGSFTIAAKGEWRTLDGDGVVKHVRVHMIGCPTSRETPWFNQKVYYMHLKKIRSASKRLGKEPREFGSILLYGEVTGSTSSLLDKNPKLLQKLPSGITTVATFQLAGRGRGSDDCVSPVGELIFSTCVRHPQSLDSRAPVVFIQYIATLAILEGIRSYGEGHDEIPVRLKWPNGIYVEDPQAPEKNFVKIGRTLVTSNYVNGEFVLVVGCRINVSNEDAPASLMSVLEKLNSERNSRGIGQLEKFKMEHLLARILVVFEEFYHEFCSSGFGGVEERYYDYWLHSSSQRAE
ncbi:biotin holocarboxylase synthetase [Rhizina undulata]